MIVRPRPRPLALLFILRGSVVPMILPRLGAVVAVATAVAGWHAAWPQHLADLTPAPFLLFGTALSIFLGFRNNACYERWWEGRRQWGQLIAESRGLAREVVTVVPDEPGLRRRLASRVVAFAHALRDQLRAGGGDAMAEWLPEAERIPARRSRSLPDAVMLAIAADLGGLRARGALSDILYAGIAERMMAMTGIQTACERLRSTPTPFTYSLLLHRTAWLFCLMLPFGLVGTLGFATPLITAILAYAFFGLDALGDELEQPFGTTANALPLDAMVRLVEIAVGEALGDPLLPMPLEPSGFVLL